MDWELIAQIATPILLIISAVLGLRWRKFKAMLKEASEVIVALGLVSTRVTEALEDDTITADERKAIVDAAKVLLEEVEDVVEAAKELVGR